nr:cation:dicarboxylase symporter family transporter [Sphingobium sp. SYK-6]
MSNAGFILIALILGLVLGLLGDAYATGLASGITAVTDPVGSLWLNGLRMTVVPLVVSLLITGVAQAARAARAGRIAGLALGWILAAMAISGTTGAFLTPLLIQLWPMPAGSADALKAALGSGVEVAAVPPFGEFLTTIVPTNPVAAAASDAILPLLVFTGAFAFAITRLPEASRGQLTGFFAATADALIIVIGWVLRLAPIGVFALAFGVGARSGAAIFGAVLHYVIVLSSVGIFIALVAYLVAVLGGRIALRDYAREIVPVQALAISTQSSLACLPIMLRKARQLGVHESTADVVLPMAVALLRATGPAMNIGVALYVAHWFGVTVGPAQLAMAILVCVLTSLSSVSLPGQISFVTAIAPICIVLGAPVEPLALLLAVETIPDIFRTLGNVMMDISVTTAIGQRDGISEAEARDVL